MKIEDLVDALSAEADAVQVDAASSAVVHRRATAQRLRVISAFTAAALVMATAAVAVGRGGGEDEATVAAGEAKTARIRIVTTGSMTSDDDRYKSAPPMTSTVLGDFDFSTRRGDYVETTQGELSNGGSYEQARRTIERGSEQWEAITEADTDRLGINAKWRHDVDASPLFGESFDPYDALATVEPRSSGVEREGTEVIDGVETTRYRVVIDEAKLAKTYPTTTTTIGSAPGWSKSTVISNRHDETIWVDSAGRLRRMHKHLAYEFTPEAGTTRYVSTTDITVDVLAFGVDMSDWQEPSPDDVIEGEAYRAILSDYIEKKDRDDCKGTYTAETQADGTKQYSCQTPSHPEMTTTSVVSQP